MTATHPTSAPVRAHRPGARAWLALIRAEAKMVLRDTSGLVVPIGLPILLLIMNGLGEATDTVLPDAGGRTVFDVFVIPVILAVVVGTIGVINMPSFLASYRRSGVLRRLAVTPASPAMVLIAQVVIGFIQTAFGVALALGAAMLLFDAQLPVNLPAALGVFVLGTLALYALGMVVASLAPTPNSAVALGLIGFFGIGALGGMFGAVQNLPGPLADIGQALPFGAMVEGLSAAWAGAPIPTSSLLWLTAAIIVGTAVAARFFRWS